MTDTELGLTKRMRNILVTGGTGSLGSALVPRLLAETGVERVVILSRDELKQAQMAERITDSRVRFFLGDVRDVNRLKVAFFGIDTVVHAAALKRVDAVINDPREILKTNIQGTANVLDAATARAVQRVLLISSDKACEPINTYGASKMYAEHLVVSHNTYSYPRGTACSVLRYGNVLGSRGSVLHTWRAQAARGEPLTLISGMTRFVILMRHAVTLVMESLQMATGGEIFVPLLGAAHMEHMALALSSNITSVARRPGGEKYHETLVTHDEAERAGEYNGLVVIAPHLRTWRVDWPYDTWRAARPYASNTTDNLFGVRDLALLLQEVP